MNIIQYIQQTKGTSYKKGTHREKNHIVTGKYAPTTHQAGKGKWKAIN
jgi:hypothetical protein